MFRYRLWTDGGCEPNPGTGGWGYVLDDLQSRVVTENFGGLHDTTNNRMELMAIYMGLRAIPLGSSVEVVSDSNLCIQTFTAWVHKWRGFGWSRSKNKFTPPKNLDLVQAVYHASKPLMVKYRWVRGHSGVRLNERADYLAYCGMMSATDTDEPLPLIERPGVFRQEDIDRADQHILDVILGS